MQIYLVGEPDSRQRGGAGTLGRPLLGEEYPGGAEQDPARTDWSGTDVTGIRRDTDSIGGYLCARQCCETDGLTAGEIVNNDGS